MNRKILLIPILVILVSYIFIILASVGIYEAGFGSHRYPTINEGPLSLVLFDFNSVMLLDASLYVGDMNEFGMPHGEGERRWISPNIEYRDTKDLFPVERTTGICIYIGEFNAGERHGTGTITCERPKIDIEFKNECPSRWRHGDVCSTRPHYVDEGFNWQMTYIGGWNMGQRHGNFVLTNFIIGTTTADGSPDGKTCRGEMKFGEYWNVTCIDSTTGVEKEWIEGEVISVNCLDNWGEEIKQSCEDKKRRTPMDGM